MTADTLLTTDGKKIFLDRGFNSSPTRTVPSSFKVGIGTTNPALSDTDLVSPVPFSGTDEVDDCDATTGWTDSADMTVSLNTTTFKEGTGSLNLTKDGTGSDTASTSKTTTSQNLTSNELSLWFYIVDTTALAKLAVSSCLTIRFGSDSSNYYQWVKNKSFFAIGWNLIDGLTSATASVTGSPVITACDYTYVAITATGSGITWSAGDFAMDDLKVVSSDDYTKAFESGYPSIDFNTLNATVRCRVSAVQANGYPVSEVGVFNSDGTPLLHNRSTFSPVSKTSDDELIFVIKTVVE